MANFRRETYPTWQEASIVVKRFNIKSGEEYSLIYNKIDPLLPSNPSVFYKDFPGWKIFLGNGFYETWAESLPSVIRLGITNWKQYYERRHFDRKLRSRPEKHYADFSWDIRQFIVERPKQKPELFHEFKHEKEFEECY